MTVLGGSPCFADGMPLDGDGGGACVVVGFNASVPSGGQAIPSGVETTVNWSSKANEVPAGFMNLATETATIPFDGRYVVNTGVELVTAAAGSVYLRLYVSGAYAGGNSGYAGLATTITPSFGYTKFFTAGQTVQVRVFQNTGFAVSLIGCCAQSFLNISGWCL